MGQGPSGLGEHSALGDRSGDGQPAYDPLVLEPLWFLASAVTLVLFLVGMWFAVRRMIRLDGQVRDRLAERYGVTIENGPQGHWRIVTVGEDGSTPMTRLRRHVVVFLVQLGLWMGFVLVVCGGLAAVAVAGALLNAG
jgi:hypothetical protein